MFPRAFLAVGMLKYWKDSIIIFGLFLLGLLFLGDGLLPEKGEIISGGDVTHLFGPSLEFAYTAIQNGRVPLWNPYLFLGFPQYAEPQLSTFYPFVWLFSRFNVPTAISWLFAVHLGLTAAGGYVLIRQLKGSRIAGVVTGVVLTFNAFLIAHLFAGHLPHIMTIAYVPWLLAAAIWALRPRSFWQAVGTTMIAAVPLALAILAGYAPFFPFLVVSLLLMIVWQTWPEKGKINWPTTFRILGQLAGIGLFAGLLAAVQLLPTLEFTTISSRIAEANYSFANSYAMPYWNLLTLLMPDLFGAPVGDIIYWANVPIFLYWEFAIYVGIFPLIMFVLAYLVGKRSWRFWVVVGMIALVIALGASGGIHYLLYQIVPGFAFFRVPARFAYLFVLSVALLTGLMFDRWFGLPEHEFRLWEMRLKKWLLWGCVLLLVMIGISIFWQAVQQTPASSIRIRGITTQLVRFLILFSASLALLIWGYGRTRAQIAILALFLLLVDYWGHGNKLIALTDADPDLGWIMADLALPTQRDDFRVTTSGLSKNAAVHYGFHHVSGYDDFRTEKGTNLAQLAGYDVRMLQLLGVRYNLSGPESNNDPSDGVSGWNLLTEPAGVTIYERHDALPKAFVVHDVIPAVNEDEALEIMKQPEHDWAHKAVVQIMPDTRCEIEAGDPTAAEVKIQVYEPERIELMAKTTKAGWLVLNDLYYPGWKATVNDVETPIQPTNYGLRGICLPPGENEVVFHFRPAIFRIGATITILAWALLGIAAAYVVINDQRKRNFISIGVA